MRELYGRDKNSESNEEYREMGNDKGKLEYNRTIWEGGAVVWR